MHRRVSNWPRALADYVAAHEQTPFSWGTHDCIMFACGGIEAVTGHDPAHHWRGKYSTAMQAARIFKDWGGFEEMIATIAGGEGFDEQPITMARRGDLVLLQQGKRPVAGICLGVFSAFAGPEHLTMVKTAACSRSWRVG